MIHTSQDLANAIADLRADAVALGIQITPDWARDTMHAAGLTRYEDVDDDVLDRLASHHLRGIEVHEADGRWVPAPGDSDGWTLPEAEAAVAAGIIGLDGETYDSADVRIVEAE